MPRINLLPWRETERKRRRQEFFFSLGAAIATAALVTLVGRWHMSSAISHQRERNALLESEIKVLDEKIEEILGLESQKRALLARMEIIETLQRSRPEIVHVFDELVQTLPEGVYLGFVRQSGGRIELQGVTQSSTRVSAFMRNVDDSRWLADPALKVVETKGKNAARGASFTLFVNQRGQQLDPDADDEDAGSKVAAK